jgi:hypothetical protein
MALIRDRIIAVGMLARLPKPAIRAGPVEFTLPQHEGLAPLPDPM